MSGRGCIYLITNIITNKQYVGQTQHETPEKRFKQHWNSSLRKNGIIKKDSSPLHRAMRKYDKDAFKVETLCVVPHNSLHIMEEYYAEELETYTWNNPLFHPKGYNARPCGLSWIGMKHSEKSKRLMSEMRKGIPLTGQHRENVIKASILRIGIKKSEEFCKRLSIIHKGKKLSKHTKSLISLANKGRKFSPEIRARMKLRGNKGFWKNHRHTELSKKKMSESRMGVKLSPEHIEKIASKLRGKKQGKLQKENARLGRINSMVENGAKGVKLTKENVLEIIDLKKSGSAQTELAKKFNVQDSVITRILSGDRWGHITGIKPQEKKGKIRVKLGIEKARDIRKLYSSGDETYATLAEKYEVNKSTIAKIVKNEFYPE